MDKYKQIALTWIAIAIGTAALIVGLVAAYTPRQRHSRYNGNAVRNNTNAEMMNESGMYGAMAGMLGGLTGKTGDDFALSFLDQMIVHHQGAVAMARIVLERSDRPELRKLAEDIIRSQTAEVELMKQWQIEWGTKK